MSGVGKCAIIGIGQTGCRAINELSQLKQSEFFTLMAIDTDKNVLNDTLIGAEHKILAGVNWRDGLGCGGDSLAGSRAIAAERPLLEEKIRDFELIFIVGGLGRGTATGGAPVLLSVAKKNKIPAFLIVTLPFSIEGNYKRRMAENALKNELYPAADAVLALPNDLLFSVLPGTTPLAECFELSNLQLAKTVISLALIFRGGNILPANFSDFKALLQKRKSNISIGIGTSSAKDDAALRTTLIMERMLMSPLLGGESKIAEADALIISLLGDPELGAGESVGLMEKIIAMNHNSDTGIISSVSTDESLQKSLLLSVITVKFDRQYDAETSLGSELALPSTPSRKKSRIKTDDSGQGVLNFSNMSRGIMERTSPNYLNGEDLDIPTFQRRDIEINPGE